MFGVVSVLRSNDVATSERIFRGAAASFKQDGTIRTTGRQQVGITCDETFSSDWRFEILRYSDRGGIVVPGSVYVFGVYNGRSIKILRQFFPSSATWGFDSFQGIPTETDPEPIRLKAHSPGSYKTAHTAITLRESILTDERSPRRNWSGAKRQKELQLRASMVDWGGMVIPTGQLELEPGRFEDVLEDHLAARLRMQPAAYIDMDATLYSSTFKALDWMFSSGLVQKGTLIGYDSFWQLACVTYSDKRASDRLHPLQTTAGRAHRDIAQKYGVRFACVAGPCATKQPPDPLDLGACTRHGAVIFQVQSLATGAELFANATTYESGFTMSDAEVSAYK